MVQLTLPLRLVPCAGVVGVANDMVGLSAERLLRLTLRGYPREQSCLMMDGCSRMLNLDEDSMKTNAGQYLRGSFSGAFGEILYRWLDITLFSSSYISILGIEYIISISTAQFSFYSISMVPVVTRLDMRSYVSLFGPVGLRGIEKTSRKQLTRRFAGDVVSHACDTIYLVDDTRRNLLEQAEIEITRLYWH